MISKESIDDESIFSIDLLMLFLSGNKPVISQ